MPAPLDVRQQAAGQRHKRDCAASRKPSGGPDGTGQTALLPHAGKRRPTSQQQVCAEMEGGRGCRHFFPALAVSGPAGFIGLRMGERFQTGRRGSSGPDRTWDPVSCGAPLAGRRSGGPRVQFVNSHTRISPLGLSLGSGLPAGGLAERPIAWVASAMQLAGGPPATECSLSWHDWPSWRPRPPSSSEI